MRPPNGTREPAVAGSIKPLRSSSRLIGKVMLACLVPLCVSAHGSGALDPAFGTGGLVVSDFGGVENAAAVAIQPDGRIVVAGVGNTVSDNDFLLARYLTDGTLDPSFANGGVTVTDFGGVEYFSALVIQPDGKIVGAGRSDSNSALVRYMPDGSLDAGFGTGGLVRSNLGSFDEFEAVALQADGKLVAAGTSLRGNFDFALARFNADGTPDRSFGGGTGATVSDWGAPELPFDVAIQSDGRIVVVGLFERLFTDPHGIRRANDDFAVARYNTDGTLDATFGVNGLVTTEFTAGANELAESVAIQADGKIVAAGTRIIGPASDFALARYNADGTLDATFGHHGLILTDVRHGGAAVLALAIQADEKILAFGTSTTATTAGDFALVRYLPGGGLDSSFGHGGIVTTDLSGGTEDEGGAVALQADGKAVVAGLRNDNKGGFDVALARYVTADDDAEPLVPVLTAHPSVLSPPDHKLRPVTITVSAADGRPYGPHCSITDVQSSEGVRVPGQTDWRITGPLTVRLRAESGGWAHDRVYTIVVSCPTSASASVTVRVSRDHLKSKSQ